MSNGWSTASNDVTAHEPTGRELEAVLFDFGGVFINSPFAAAAGAAADLGIDEAELLELVFGPYETDGDHPWHQLERGERTFEDANGAIAGLIEAAGHPRVEPMEVLMALAADRSVRDFMVELVRDVRGAGLATGIITNNIAEFGSAWRAMIPVDELFDDVVDSSAVGLRKPDPEIYRLACRRLDVDPAAALFVDDHHGNVVAARSIGLGAICCGLSVDTTRAAAQQVRSLIG